jgi:ligand-binding SRPBCC domain-containing protein
MDRPRGFTDVQVTGPFVRFEHRRELTTVDGGTRMTDDWTHVSPLGLLGRLVDRFVLAPHMRRVLEMRAAAIKAEAERR